MENAVVAAKKPAGIQLSKKKRGQDMRLRVKSERHAQKALVHKAAKGVRKEEEEEGPSRLSKGVIALLIFLVCGSALFSVIQAMLGPAKF